MIKIIPGDDHDVVLTGMKLLIETQEDLKIVGEGRNGREILATLENGVLPDVLITDLNMSDMNGLDLIAEVAQKYPLIKMIILSMEESLSGLITGLKNGANGYLTKTVDYDELFFCIRQVSNGARYICCEMNFLMIKSLQKDSFAYRNSDNAIIDSGLTEREMEILNLIVEGFNNAQIAKKLYLSKRTIEGHRDNLLKKTSSKNTASLVKHVILAGII